MRIIFRHNENIVDDFFKFDFFPVYLWQIQTKPSHSGENTWINYEVKLKTQTLIKGKQGKISTEDGCVECLGSKTTECVCFGKRLKFDAVGSFHVAKESLLHLKGDFFVAEDFETADEFSLWCYLWIERNFLKKKINMKCGFGFYQFSNKFVNKFSDFHNIFLVSLKKLRRFYLPKYLCIFTFHPLTQINIFRPRTFPIIKCKFSLLLIALQVNHTSKSINVSSISNHFQSA